MALRALLFSKDPETNTVLALVCQAAGVRLEVCDDIFTAMEKGTKQSFGIVLVDWSSQPEAGFLVKRARESAPNREFAAIAIVTRDPSAAEMRENRLQFLIHRPLAADEVRDVLSNALQKVRPGDAENEEAPEGQEEAAESTPAEAAEPSDTNAAQGQKGEGKFAFEWAEDRPNEGEGAADAEPGPARNHARDYGGLARRAGAGALALTALILLWSGHSLLIGFAKSPEGKGRVMRESLAAFFHLEQPDVMPVIGAKPEGLGGAPAASSPETSIQGPQLQVVESQQSLGDSHTQLRRAADFPLPTPQLDAAVSALPRKAAIPDSIRNSAPITPPVVVTVNPAQMMSVSTPPTQAASSQTFSEPVAMTEEAARSLLVRSVNPDYPAEAVAQKLHGPVVLQAMIGRDGSVEDLKIVRGYFVLGKAAIAAVKQWQFKPYLFNGKPARTLTQITVNFDVPQS